MLLLQSASVTSLQETGLPHSRCHKQRSILIRDNITTDAKFVKIFLKFFKQNREKIFFSVFFNNLEFSVFVSAILTIKTSAVIKKEIGPTKLKTYVTEREPPELIIRKSCTITIQFDFYRPQYRHYLYKYTQDLVSRSIRF